MNRFRLFDMFDSGTGWPSFTKPLELANAILQEDRSHLMVRTWGHRCRFIPKEDLEKKATANTQVIR